MSSDVWAPGALPLPVERSWQHPPALSPTGLPLLDLSCPVARGKASGRWVALLQSGLWINQSS